MIFSLYEILFIYEFIIIIIEEIQTTGMVLPFAKDIYKPILNRLQAEGLSWTERVVKKG